MEKAEEMKNQIQRSPTANEWTIAMSTKSSYLNGLLSIANAAKKAMIDHNMRLVVHIARYYRYRGLTFTDLVQEGSFGLVKAVEKYDAERGFRFSTYASWWIKQAMSRACAEKGRIVRLPAHIHDLAVR
jgi:DNA-directed RNA polymerase sigma subunit (sigma70/sigma32)